LLREFLDRGVAGGINPIALSSFIVHPPPLVAVVNASRTAVTASFDRVLCFGRTIHGFGVPVLGFPDSSHEGHPVADRRARCRLRGSFSCGHFGHHQPLAAPVLMTSL